MPVKLTPAIGRAIARANERVRMMNADCRMGNEKSGAAKRTYRATIWLRPAEPEAVRAVVRMAKRMGIAGREMRSAECGMRNEQPIQNPRSEIQNLPGATRFCFCCEQNLPVTLFRRNAWGQPMGLCYACREQLAQATEGMTSVKMMGKAVYRVKKRLQSAER